ncbi:MAG: ribosomal protein S18-alanine N-acetyltransferase [Pseudomonadota bacterium]|nr:ribosomal protein S18-alanine N-acetyltransferase [Pseudomonadota bacterium]
MSAVVEQERFLVREMKHNDLNRVIAIERDSYQYPWSEKIFEDCLASKYTCLVAEVDDFLIAYCIVSFAAGEGHILNVCVCPTYRNQKFAQRLIKKVIREFVDSSVLLLFLEVRVSNLPAQKLYCNLGFERVGRRVNYYPAAWGREDAYIFLLKLNSKHRDSSFDMII